MKEILKDKNLLTEITRIKEMMGVQLLSEQAKPFADILMQLLSARGLSAYTSRITKLLRNPNNNDIKKLLDELKVSNKVNSAVKKAITDFEEEIVNRHTEQLYTDMIKDGLSNGLTKRQITTKITNDLKSIYGEFVDEKILAKFKLGLSKRITDIESSLSPKTKPVEIDVTEVPPTPVVDTNLSLVDQSWQKVTDSITPETMAKINGKYGTKWGEMLQQLKTAVTTPFKNSLRLQNEIIEDFGKWSKAGANERPVIKNKIIAKLKSLENSQRNILDATNVWINTRVKPLAIDGRGKILDFEINELYQAIDKKEGWGKIKYLEEVYNSVGIAIKDIIDNKKLLNMAYLKVLVKPITIPINITSKIINKMFDKNINMIGKLTPEQSTALRKWFLTTNPAGFEGLKSAFKNNGKIGGITYVGFQALYRYFWLSTVFGIYRTVGALFVEGVDLTANTEISDNKIINYLFGTKDFDELNKKFKENPNLSKYEYAEVILEMINKQSEPFKKWIGVWPVSKVVDVIIDAIILIQNGLLTEKIRDVEQEVDKSKEEVERVTGETIDDITDRAENIVDNINDSEPGFRLWCKRNQKEFAGYNVDNDGLGRTIENGAIITWLWNNDTKTFDEY
jgi:hypothetical protein